MKRLFIAFLFLFFPIQAAAKHMAVLDFTSVKADKEVLNVMAEMVRNTAAKQLRSKGISVMDKANMLSVLADQGKDASCIAGECEIELGRNIGADYVVTGQLSILDEDWILSLSLYETASGSKLNGTTIEKSSSKELRRSLREETKMLLAGIGKRGGGREFSIQEGFGEQQDDDWTASGATTVTVSFRSEPSGATVLVDGEILCEATPCSQNIEEGARQVRIIKKRYRAEVQDLYAKDGASVSVQLKAKFGWYSVDSQPSGVPVLVDGKSVGKTPIRKREIDPGIHKLKVESRCYKPLSYKFQTKANKHKLDIPKLPLKIRKSGVQVTARRGKDAMSADVYVDGKKVGRTGQTLTLPLCSKKLELRTERGVVWTKQLSLIEKQIQKIKADVSSSGLKVSDNSSANQRKRALEKRRQKTKRNNNYAVARRAPAKKQKSYRRSRSNRKACYWAMGIGMTGFGLTGIYNLAFQEEYLKGGLQLVALYTIEILGLVYCPKF